MNKRNKKALIITSGVALVAIFLIILIPMLSGLILELRLRGDWIILNSSDKVEGTISFFSDGTADFAGIDGRLSKYKALDSSHIKVTHLSKDVSIHTFEVTINRTDARLFGNDAWYILERIP